jgi:hypothetical protein
MVAELQETPQLPDPPSSYRVAVTAFLVLAAVIVLIAVTSYTAGRDVVWIDPVTGSIMEETQWFGQTTESVVKTSAIEQWINTHDSHSNNWKFLHAAHKTALGQTFGSSCANAPAIYPLRAGSLDDLYILNSTDQEINDFIHVMQTGTEDEKLQAVQAAVQRAISQPPNRVPNAGI